MAREGLKTWKIAFVLVVCPVVIYSSSQIEQTSYFLVMFMNPSHHLPNPSIILHEALTTESLHGEFDNGFEIILVQLAWGFV